MSEARPRQRGRSRDASAIKASRKEAGAATAAVSRSAISRGAPPRPPRPAPAEKLARAEASSGRRRRSRDASVTGPSTTPAKAVGPRARPTTGSRDTSPSPARVRARVPKRVGFTCPPCGRFVPTEVDGVVLRALTGSPPRFCAPGCRQAAYRRRQAGVSEGVALQLRGGRDRSLAERKGTGDA